MTEEEITNWLIFGVAVAWFCKIGFHFAYLKKVDKSIKELNFVSFYLNITNFFKSVLLISPFFFSKTMTADQEINRRKWKVKISAYALWTMFALTGFYLYHHPPKKEKTVIEYDLTKEKVR